MKIRNELAVYTLKLLKERQQKGFFKDPDLLRMIDQWENKIKQPENFKMSADAKQNYLEGLEDQRKFLARLKIKIRN